MSERFTGIFVLILTLSPLTGTKVNVLYEKTDPVTILTGSNIKHTIHNSKTAWLVEFYNAWCGHCIHFAPVWKEVGSYVKGWSDLISIAAIDCSIEENNVACRDYDIKGYPTIKYFASAAPLGAMGAEFSARKVDDIQEDMIQFLQSQAANHTGNPLLQRLLPLRSLEHIWQDLSPGIQHVIVIFEKEKSCLGNQVILDTLQYRTVLVRRIHQDKVSQYGVKTFPSMYRIDKGGTFQHLSSNADRQELVNTILNAIGQPQLPVHSKNKTVLQGQNEPSDSLNSLGNRDAPVKESDALLQAAVHQQDLHSALRYSFQMEIGTYKDIEAEAFTALRAYVYVLAKYFPGPQSVMRYLWSVNNWLENAGGRLTGEEWLQQLDNLQTDQSYLPREIAWTGCRGSQPNLRGFPCSMWTLFHTLTVNSAIDSLNDQSFQPREVLQAMRGYIKYFFGCRECSTNFMKRAKHLEEQVHKPNDSILFLWRSHNRANYHLHGDITEDPAHPKVQFPSVELCPECRDTTETDSTEILWKENKVMALLKKVYYRTNIIQDADLAENIKNPSATETLNLKFIPGQKGPSRTQTWEKPRKYKDGAKNDKQVKSTGSPARLKIEELKKQELESRHVIKKSIGWSGALTSVDISICVIFYILCTGIIVLLYFHLTVHKRMNLSCCLQKLPV